MTTGITRRAMLSMLASLALPVAAVAQGYSPKPSTLRPATETNESLRKSVYSAADLIKQATVRIDRESYVSKEETPSGFDFTQRANGFILQPLNSKNTYLASCNHTWDLYFYVDLNKGVERTLEAAAKRGVINPRKEDIKTRMKVLGYTIPPSKGVLFDKERDIAVLDVTDIMPSLDGLVTPFPLDARKPIHHEAGSKVFWINHYCLKGDFPFVEANVLAENVCFSDERTGKINSIENIETDTFIGCESGKPVFNFVDGKPIFAGVITGRIENRKNGKPMNRTTFTSARDIIEGIRKYEQRN